MDKIIVKLMGGVGNQMFQYAVGYAIAKKTGFELYLDASSYNSDKLRNFELLKFSTDIKFADFQDCSILNKKHFFKKTLYKDKKKIFYPEILKINHSAYLNGYWQSEKYFSHIKNDIKNIFQFKNTDFLQNTNMLNDIKSSNSVSISIRLGDYVNNPQCRKIYFVCNKDYYTKAIEYICSKVDNPKFFVFSPEIDAACEYLPKGYEYIFSKSASWEEDMYLMRHAKHNILANSSFAWWCAWLNENLNNIVIAPSRWYTKDAKINFKDVIPDNWVKIEVSN